MKFSKEQILTIYLNDNPYGGTIYGVEEASHAYFNKKSADLTVAEAAYLAAIPKAPTYYSPFGKNKDKQIGWNTKNTHGTNMSIKFSMSSQLWINIENTKNIEGYKLASCTIKTMPKINYIDLYHSFNTYN